MAGRPWGNFVALASVVAGCSTAPLRASDAGASNPDAAVATDGGPNQADDAGVTDAAPGDASLDDAEASSAAQDADFDAAPSHWCDTQLHAFCDDFDEDPLTQGWDSLAAQSGEVTLDGLFYTSPGRALLSTVTPLTAGATGTARLGKRTIELSNDIRLAYDLRPDAIDPGAGDLAVSTIQLFASSGAIVESVHVMVSSSGASIEDIGVDGDGGAYVSSYPVAASSLSGTWTHVSLELELPREAGLGAGTVTVSLGTSVVLDHAPLSPSSQPALPVFFLGLVSAGGSSSAPSSVRFDDVTFDAIQR
ncbi:MAG TPA: hypothetical protein VGI39_11295 [Polyangiaceae bacterium]|jgi:hypothetical protein